MGTLTKDVEGNDAAKPLGAADETVRPLGAAGAPAVGARNQLAKAAPPKYPQASRRPPEMPAAGSGSSGPRRPLVSTSAGEGGFFTIHKKGQGYWTRMGTVAGAALIGALCVQFIFQERQTFRLSDDGAVIACALFALAYCALAFFLMNRPQSVEFLIATDSEMKKVNWTSREELMGSTKVVILFMFVIAIFLFLVDLFFSYLFYWMHVLKQRPL